jgi:hypothetical protein
LLTKIGEVTYLEYWIIKWYFFLDPVEGCPAFYNKKKIAWIRLLQSDVVYLGLPIAPSYMSPNAGGVGCFGVSANEYSCPQLQEPK